MLGDLLNDVGVLDRDVTTDTLGLAVPGSKVGFIQVGFGDEEDVLELLADLNEGLLPLDLDLGTSGGHDVGTALGTTFADLWQESHLRDEEQLEIGDDVVGHLLGGVVVLNEVNKV